MTAPVRVLAEPRVARLIRVPTLRASQRALAALAGALRPDAARTTAVLVPTAAASSQLQRTIERHRFGPRRPPASDREQLGLEAADTGHAICWPDLVTRAGLYQRLHARLPGAPPLLDEFERETLMRAAARTAIASGAVPPFTLRPGLVAEMLRFYDAVLRLRRTVDDVERVLCGTLEHEADSDRGAERLLAQTRFLVEAYRLFQRHGLDVDGIDEHGVRDLALSTRSPRPYRHVIVTVGDIASDSAGLWPADFDVLARLPGLARIDVVVTERVLECGLYERLEERLPGIVETRFETFEPPPTLVAQGAEGAPLWRVARDREEELLGLARDVKWSFAEPRASAAIGVDDHAIVVQRPLPYVYLARHTLEAAGLPWTASDALPLAAESYAAALDLLCECALGEWTRPALVALLRSPHFTFWDSASEARDEASRRLDEELERAGYFGGVERLRPLLASRVAEGEAASATSDARALAGVARVTLGVLDALEGVAVPARISEHARAILAFLDRYERTGSPADAATGERHLRARAAIRAALTRLGEASVAYDDPVVPFRETLAGLRRWIEARTFEPRVGDAGIHLLDAVAARYADVDAVRVLGLVDGEWPERSQRDILYPSALLADLGWPRDGDRATAARAAFNDLLRLPRLEVSVSSFTLEDDAIVQPAVLLDELESCGLVTARVAEPPPLRVLEEEGLAFAPVVSPSGDDSAAWLEQRVGRPDAADPRFHGHVQAYRREQHAVTQIDTYLQCPFRYFAERVIKLEDEREDDPGLTPRERGELTHRIFERFFVRWAAAGHGAITEDTLDAARALFAAVTDEELAGVNAADAAMERSRLLGSPVSAAMGDRVLRHELDRDAEVVERRLEEKLDGRYVFVDAEGREHVVPIRAKADRIDFLHDGRFDLIDYKTGRAPDGAVQLPIYAHVATQRFKGHRGRDWVPRAADYVAFRGRAITRALGRDDADREKRLAEAQLEFLDAVGGIQRGDFPPRPAELRTCSWCPYDKVCRKDYPEDVDG